MIGRLNYNLTPSPPFASKSHGPGLQAICARDDKNAAISNFNSKSTCSSHDVEDNSRSIPPRNL